MRKGDAKKLEILTVSEQLFCRKGYRETSVQDILDVMKTSKGSFYHHFESKTQVLETLCTQRASRAAAEMEKRLLGVIDPIARVNLVLYGAMPIRRSETTFLTMLMPQLFTQEGRTVCFAYQEALIRAFQEMLDREVSYAVSQDVLYPPSGKSQGDLVLSIVNRCWMHAARLMLDAMIDHRSPSAGELFDELVRFRQTLERMLSAPYGSIEVIRLEEWYEVLHEVERKIILPGDCREIPPLVLPQEEEN